MPLIFECAGKCSFFLNAFEIGKLPYLPADAGIEFVKGKTFWQVNYRHKQYTLALHPEGLLLGFNGTIYPNKPADLAIIISIADNSLKNDCKIYERRFTTEAEILAAELKRVEKPAQVRCPAAAPASSPADSIDLYAFRPSKQRPDAFTLAGGIVSGRF